MMTDRDRWWERVKESMLSVHLDDDDDKDDNAEDDDDDEASERKLTFSKI